MDYAALWHIRGKMSNEIQDSFHQHFEKCFQNVKRNTSWRQERVYLTVTYWRSQLSQEFTVSLCLAKV